MQWQDLRPRRALLRTLLDELELAGFLKTTGGKGLHVVLPIRPTLDWDEAKAFTKAVADFLVRTFPDRFTATLAKERRKGKIFIDYLRNAEGATAIAPYAVRARGPTRRWRRRSRGRSSSATCASTTSTSATCRSGWRASMPAATDPWARFFDDAGRRSPRRCASASPEAAR